MKTVTDLSSQVKVFSDSGQLTVREFALKSIQKNFLKSTKHQKDVLADQDPEGIHQMRVGMRRLRTALAVFADYVSLPSNLERGSKKLFTELGNVRDLDVLGMWFSDYRKATDPNVAEEKQLTKILRQLERRREKLFRAC
jgi:CHAD domain-containing protein